ncbi:hypothetical protein MD484_g40, partial [Candolleomyces efflorescens]
MNGFYQNPAYSSHYLQAYMQSQPGYYQQQQYQPTPPQYPNVPGPSNPRPRLVQPTGQWYQPGNKRCTYKDCTFTGSHSSVEIHMMDRHLIFPPGWERRPKKTEWDADPSLKGKPIPIQGTNIFLDDPEQLAAWIAERKKRFPTCDRVVDKKRKMEEAIARGQLTEEDIGLRSGKRRRANDSSGSSRGNHPHTRGRGGGRGGQVGTRGRGRGGASMAPPVLPLPPRPVPASVAPPSADDTKSDEESNFSDDDDAPEVVTSKKEVQPIVPPPEAVSEEVPREKEPQAQGRKRPPPQPKKPPKNPFAPRQSLLRNLLTPEIRITVSNLSQAIRFLVDNDFLRDVELNPGEASEAKIQVLDSRDAVQAE